jgi:hypothetical protein
VLNHSERVGHGEGEKEVIHVEKGEMELLTSTTFKGRIKDETLEDRGNDFVGHRISSYGFARIRSDKNEPFQFVACPA